MRRVRRPLSQKAVVDANAAVYHLTEPPGRPLDPASLDDAKLRNLWLEAYAAAGGSVEEVQPGQPVGQPFLGSPNWIELHYLHYDGTPVKGAQYHVRSSAFSCDSILDNNGFVHLGGVPDISGFSYWFDDDPEVYTPKGPVISTAAGVAKE